MPYVRALVGYGYPVIMPDYAGFSFQQSIRCRE